MADGTAYPGALKRWWAGDASEIFWLESTDRADVGRDVHAPEANDSGKLDWRYGLLREIRPGEVVLHYSKQTRAIVAWSRAIGAPERARDGRRTARIRTTRATGDRCVHRRSSGVSCRSWARSGRGRAGSQATRARRPVATGRGTDGVPGCSVVQGHAATSIGTTSNDLEPPDHTLLAD
jgi:hypothetical protein